MPPVQSHTEHTVQAEVWGECTGRWLGLAKGGAGRRTCIESMSSTVHRRMVAMVKAVIRARPRVVVVVWRWCLARCWGAKAWSLRGYNVRA